MVVFIQGCKSLMACTPLSWSIKKANEVQTVVTLLEV